MKKIENRLDSKINSNAVGKDSKIKTTVKSIFRKMTFKINFSLNLKSSFLDEKLSPTLSEWTRESKRLQIRFYGEPYFGISCLIFRYYA